MLSIGNGLEKNLWLHLARGSQQEQTFCIQGNPSLPVLLKRNLYGIRVTHKHCSQLTRDNSESTGTHIHKATPDNTVNGVFLTHCLCFECVYIPPYCNSASNQVLWFPSGKQLPL